MATALFLDDTQLFPDASQSIKLTRENPYFTQSDSYTLDVTLPMDILQNRAFFHSIHRMERSKSVPPLPCRLMVDNRTALNGSARVTQVTERLVKVQLLGGRSEVSFLAEDSGDFIDELPLGTIATGATTTDTGVRVAVSPVKNETSERGGYSSTYQFCLIDLAVQVISHYGFTVTRCDIDTEPWNCLYVATAKMTREAAHTLPHWTPREFLTELCNFFNVSLDIDATRRTVAIAANPSFFAGRQQVQIDPEDEYTAEITDDEERHSLATDTLAFDLSSSEGHDYDCIPDAVRDNAPAQQYGSYQAALQAYEDMAPSARKRQIFRCPVGSFAEWEHDYTDWGEEAPRGQFTQIDALAPLRRDGSAGTQLKICPVAIVMGEFQSVFGTSHTFTTRMFLPSMENPTGHDTHIIISQWGNFGGSQSGQQEEEEGATIQELVQGDADAEGQAEKEDRLQVMFIDDVPQTYSRVDSTEPATYQQLTHIVGFTDWQYKKSHRGSEHRPWSLSLNPTNATYYLGQLHQNGFSFNMKARHTFKFLSSQMPDPRSIFLIRGKRYACEKIEATVTPDGFDRLMTGYFYEML